MNKLGLVFAGGGGKGSYEIGVWKYLRQIGLDKYVSVVSGASVGALNATLFINGNLELAEQIWRESIAGEIVKIYSRKKILKAVIQPDTYGLSSRKGLIDIIDNKLSLEAISKSSIKTYVTLTELPHITDNHFIQAIEARQRKYKPTYMLLNGETPKTIKEMLLASSAIPGVFAAERLKDKFYYDGGLKDNVPIKPLYDEGCSHVIVVYLDRKRTEMFKYESNFKRIIHIKPSKHLGGILSGTLDFSSEGSKSRISLGECDAKRIYAKELDSFLKDFKENDKI